MNETQSTLKARLEEAVKVKGVTVRQARADLMRLTGMTRSNMTHWFTGRTETPTADAAYVAAEYFGVEPRWLAAGIGLPREGKKTKGRRTMAIPPGTIQEELSKFIGLYQEMDQDARDTWMKQGAALLELLGKPSRINPYGKGRGKAKARSRAKPKAAPKAKHKAPQRASEGQLALALRARR